MAAVKSSCFRVLRDSELSFLPKIEALREYRSKSEGAVIGHVTTFRAESAGGRGEGNASDTALSADFREPRERALDSDNSKRVIRAARCVSEPRASCQSVNRRNNAMSRSRAATNEAVDTHLPF